MARPKKQTVDYFPHIASSGKTIFILENQFGNDGYAFWFKILELLATTDGHVIDTGNPSEWEFLVAKTRVSDETAREILNLLGKLEAIDNELLQVGIIWSQNLVDNVSDVYKKRKVSLPTKPALNSFGQQKHEQSGVSDTGNHSSAVVMDNINPQSKVKETKVKETKVKESSNQEKTPPAAANIFTIYEQNFGMLNPMAIQSVEKWEADLGEELVIEAMRRAAVDNKGFRYAEGIMRSWANTNVKTVADAEAQDVAYKQRQKGNAPKKEKMPEWAENDVPASETAPDPEQQRLIAERIARLKTSQKREA
jgi:DnaD/phage-associated family protein